MVATDTGIHCKIPDQEDWKNAQRPIRNAGDRRMSVSKVGNDTELEACSRASCILCPEIWWWGALQDNDEEVDDAEEHDNAHDEPDDDGLASLDTDSCEEYVDADFKNGCGGNVK
jgi:hypothetical protein